MDERKLIVSSSFRIIILSIPLLTMIRLADNACGKEGPQEVPSKEPHKKGSLHNEIQGNMVLTFNRNVHFYERNTTRHHAVDIDGSPEEKYGITSFGAISVIAEGIINSGVIVIPSSICNYTVIFPYERKVKPPPRVRLHKGIRHHQKE